MYSYSYTNKHTCRQPFGQVEEGPEPSTAAAATSASAPFGGSDGGGASGGYYGGFGAADEEDSVATRTTSLIPTAPRKVRGEDVTFRYIAELVSPAPEDAGRLFVVTFYKADRTAAVREPPRRNSGVMGGNFLSRMKIRDPQGNIMTEGCFYVGAEVVINGHRFRVTEADTKTHRLMEERPDAFPHSDAQLAMGVLRDRVLGREGEVAEALHRAGQDGTLPRAALLAALEGLVGDLGQPEQGLITVMRAVGGSADAVACDSLLEALQSRGFDGLA